MMSKDVAEYPKSKELAFQLERHRDQIGAR